MDNRNYHRGFKTVNRVVRCRIKREIGEVMIYKGKWCHMTMYAALCTYNASHSRTNKQPISGFYTSVRDAISTDRA